MADFDPNDVLSADSPQAIPKTESDFAPEDILKLSPGSDFDSADVLSTSAGSDFDHKDVVALHPSDQNSGISPEEIKQIAAKHQIDPEKLRSIAPYHGVDLRPAPNEGAAEALQYGAKSAIGEAGSTLGLNIPQFAYRKLALSEPERKALDEAKELSNSRKGTLEKATEFGRQIAAPIGGAVKGAGTISKIGRVAEASGIGAAASASNAKEGEELEAAKSGAALGGFLGIGSELLGKVLAKSGASSELSRKAGPELDLDKGAREIADQTRTSEKILEDQILGESKAIPREDLNKLVDEQVSKDTLDHITPEMRARLADDIIETRTVDFAEDLSGKRVPFEQASEEIAEHLRTQPEYTANRYKDFVLENQAEKYLKQTGARVEEQAGFYGKAANFISDAQYVARDIDRRTRAGVEGVLREGNKDYNKSTYALQRYRNQLDDVFNTNNKLGVDLRNDQTSQKIYQALQSPEGFQALSPAEKQAAMNVKNYFEDIYKFQTGGVTKEFPGVAPLPTQKLENYLPNYSKPMDEIVPLIERKWDEAIREVRQATGRMVHDFSELSQKEFQALSQQGPMKDLVDFAKWGKNNASVDSGASLNNTLSQALYDRKGKQALDIVAKSSLHRTGEIPEFLKEQNVYKLMNMYAANTIRGLFLRRFADQMAGKINLLERAGADVDANYLRRLLQDVQGTRTGTAAEANRNLRSSYYRSLDQAIEKSGGKDTFLGAGLTGLKSIPEILREVSMQIYPASMGLNIRSALQNATSAVTKLAPEMGGVYGYRVTTQAALEAAKSMVSGTFAQDLAKVRAMGNTPAGFIRQGEAAIAEGLKATGLFRGGQAALDGMSKVLMSLHQTTEAINRVMTSKAGEIMGREIAAQKPGAMQALARFPESIQREVARNPNMAGELLSKFLNDTTQYNYNRLSMNEFGRTMGPLFSVFTKWPAATAGDIIYTMREKGLIGGSLRNAEKYLAPLILLHTASVALTGQKATDFTGETLSDREKLVVGSHGLSQGAPVGNVIGLLKGETGTPPAFSIAKQTVIDPLMKGEAPSGRKFAASLAQSFLPGAGVIRFITQDLVTALTGHKPAGSDFFERTQQGINKLSK